MTDNPRDRTGVGDGYVAPVPPNREAPPRVVAVVRTPVARVGLKHDKERS